MFSRAIHQSGSSIHHWTLNRNGKAQFERFAKKANCNVGTAKENLKCLKNLDGRSLVYAHKEKMVCQLYMLSTNMRIYKRVLQYRKFLQNFAGLL